MSKRSNPFVDDFIPQCKTHVGLKQFNNNEDRMQKVYKKTLQLLFRGAKKLPEDIIKNSDVILSLASKDSMKQLQINKDGSLLNSKIIRLEKSPPIQECVCGCAVVECQCSYCEVTLCRICSHLCARCDLHFCSKCSLIGSEGTEICVSCCG
ncbi:apoptosis regulatory protein Siva [Epargyreus clarus]|uniref:apoptosis regulatory protein Siva n=1 Tax=Epargyreus clarus TaxID=520877 RepID=UPI003C2D64FF